jgi:Tfp pilus assembly protein PilV
MRKFVLALLVLSLLTWQGASLTDNKSSAQQKDTQQGQGTDEALRKRREEDERIRNDFQPACARCWNRKAFPSMRKNYWSLTGA